MSWFRVMIADIVLIKLMHLTNSQKKKKKKKTEKKLYKADNY
jgi:hypothetical protein